MNKGSGVGAALMLAGGFFAYAGVRGFSILKAIQNVVQGAPPSTGQSTSLIGNPSSQTGAAVPPATTTGTGGVPLPAGSGSGGTPAQNKALGQQMAAARGWTGNEWTSLLNLWNGESGWDSHAANPKSNARGIPQSIQGWSSYPPGDARAQIQWGLNYIAQRYGTPSKAWAFWQAQSPHWY